MKQQRFAIGEEVIIQSSIVTELNGRTATITEAEYKTSGVTMITHEINGRGWRYRTDIDHEASAFINHPNRWWLERSLKKKPKGSDLTFPELMANLNQPIKSMSKA